MKELHRDPPRWLESGYLSEELASELAAYGAEAPAAASKARMLEQLSAQLVEVAAPLAPQPVALVKLKLVCVASAILAGAVGLLQLARPAPSTLHEPDAVLSEPTRMAPLAETTLVSEARVEEPELPAPRAPVLAPAPRVRPSAQRGVASAGVRREPVVPQPPAQEVEASRPDVLAELTMLARARRALLNDPARALELSEEHARTYPRGTFDEEREVLAIESLLKLGRKDEACARERMFEAKFPRSAQITHLAKLIAKPSH
jgi:hypothetical protein